MRAVDLGQLVDGSLQMLRRLLEENIQIETELPEHCPTINADVGTLEQVLMNLAVNARDAMPGGGELVIRAKNVFIDMDAALKQLEAYPGEFVHITVKDTGYQDTLTISKQVLNDINAVQAIAHLYKS